MPQSSKSLQGKRVLIVEDDPNSARLFTDLLHTKGTIITHVNNGIDAIRHINLDICDLVILDLRLPGENGFVVTEQIKQKPDLPPAVIVVSAFADKQNRMRAFQAGADAFFSKPVNLKEFLLVASNFAGNSYRQRCYATLQHLNTIQEEVVHRPGHGTEVKEICTALAGFYNIKEESLLLLEQAALLHDLGKIAALEGKSHSKIGAEIIETSGYSKNASLLVLYHHDFPETFGLAEPTKTLVQVIQIAERVMEIYNKSPQVLEDDLRNELLPQPVANYIRSSLL
ncbi:MAG TPA: response regulator [Syntrophomonadaceae bacterium]|nr:response regulator [Syntrophomonadaceae bacterium]